MLYLQACETAEAVIAVGWVAMANVYNVQFGELREELQVFKRALIEDVVAVHNLQAGQARGYYAEKGCQRTAFARKGVCGVDG